MTSYRSTPSSPSSCSTRTSMRRRRIKNCVARRSRARLETVAVSGRGGGANPTVDTGYAFSAEAGHTPQLTDKKFYASLDEFDFAKMRKDTLLTIPKL